MRSKMDRQGSRTPADLERKYNFDKRMSEATSAAAEARRIVSSISENEKGLSLKVQSLEKGYEDVKAELAMKVETDADGNLKSKMHIGADLLTIETDNISLSEDGTLTTKAKTNVENFDGTTEEKDVSVTMAGGMLKITSPAAFVKNGKTYAPLIEFSDGTKTAVIALENGNGTITLRVVEGTFFDFKDKVVET